MKAILAGARFAALPAVQLVAIASFFLGGAWLWLGSVLFIAVLAFDETGGEYLEPVERPKTLLLDGTLYAAVAMMALLTFSLVLITAMPGSAAANLSMVLGIGDTSSSPIAVAGAIVSVGLVSGPAVGAFGHELMHRPTRSEWWLGQFLLLNCLYTALAVEHVFGHHRNVGTADDVASVARGTSFWRYLPKAMIGIRIGAARIEAARMRRRRLHWLTVRNRFLQGLMLEVGVVIAILALAGPPALAAFLASAAIGVFLIELSNYIGHYGLVRVPGRPVLPRHSWNAPRFLSSSVTVNLPRHSHHHVSASTPYWDLRVLDAAPVMPFGLFVMSVIALMPSLWFRVIRPPLEDWDRRLASAEELALLRWPEVGAAAEARTTPFAKPQTR